MLQVGILGASGRMGRNLIDAVYQDAHTQLHSATVRPESHFLNADAGELAGIGNIDVALTAQSATAYDKCNVMIDFTLPNALATNLQLAIANQIPIVIGTTGLNEAQLALLDDAATHIPIVFAANYSVGVNLLIKLSQQAAQIMGETADIEIIETHHRHKIDAPSGTALALGNCIAATLGRDLHSDAVYGREGHTGERPQQQIGFATVRGGDVVGDHTVLFAELGERIELTHKASSRMTFAKGAVRAAKWLADKPNGLYSMMDVLSLNDL
ncbi:MAG: 4-hydroxy-tetrahydrodipicolinate reductase [Glaciecola sp. HTCC2999]|jgi:4-hydroxy-tetrahydrodipicolinate reductase|nr:MAG: 4-hydroxy-tetrahydrodipicolinate reductase [Glaciecola sp. HTCC2999]